MSFKKKKGGDGGAAAAAAAKEAEIRQQRDIAVGDLSNYGNQGINTLESSKALYNPLESQRLYNSALDKYNNFDVNANQASDEAYNANYKPILSQVTANLGNSFSGMGTAGRNNSRGQFAQAVLSRSLADNAGKQLLGIRNDARNQYLNETQSLFNPAMNVQQQLQGINTNKANAQSQLGQSLANTRTGAAGNIVQIQQQNAQLQQQNAERAAAQKAQSKSGIGSAIGGALSLGTAMFSDSRLKENIKKIGKLPNGVPLYSYNIKGTDLPQIGVLAQEAQLYKPNAVHLDESGYLKVNYAEVAV
jgi:Chaperone of endosialidase